MNEPDHSFNVPPYFVVLPDHDTPVAVAPARTGAVTRRVNHPSGRPWIVFAGRWRDRILYTQLGGVRVALVGQFAVTEADLARMAGRISSVAGLDQLGAQVPGSFHLVAAGGDLLRVQGTASGLRWVFYAAHDDCTVASDRADVLATLFGDEVDDPRLAARFLYPLPHPISDLPVWAGVSAVPPGEYLLLDGAARTSSVRSWWTVPTPSLSRREGATELRRALSEAVRARADGEGMISCDLSGGLDSTPLCCLAAQRAEGVVAVTVDLLDPAADDLSWARKVAEQIDGLKHIVLEPDDLPQFYAGLLGIDHVLDDPNLTLLVRPRYAAVLHLVAQHGSRLHLTGLGGDSLLHSAPAYCYDLLRRDPITAVKLLRTYRVIGKWPMARVIRNVIRNEPYESWLSRQPRSGPPASTIVGLDWGNPLVVPSWMTSRAVDAASALIRDLSVGARPLAPLRGVHWDLFSTRDNARLARSLDQVGGSFGVSLSAQGSDHSR